MFVFTARLAIIARMESHPGTVHQVTIVLKALALYGSHALLAPTTLELDYQT